MLSGFAKLLLTGTAIAPVGLSYAWVAYMADQKTTALLMTAGSLFLVLICIWMLRYAQKNLESIPFIASTIEAADRENMAFMLLYLLPLFTASFSQLNWQIWVPVIVIFAVIASTGYSYHFNPLLGLMGWHFYKVSTPEGVTYVLVTKKELRRAQEGLTVVQLTEYIVLDIGD
ncbi:MULTISPECIES: hypothetical protein [Aeromonas]|uniref:hypothetical protein n=1 Tax=Aeromonas TaxID=642 RepID=UPI0004D79979|nr:MULTISPECIES: hypothetical protein [Aeromonas]EBG7527990.1 hypothetical protein [Salmonella enterica]EHU9083141.1 hypothetical protein [Escherichia coli]KDV03079.1 hypothetical protein AW15_07935 [Aeromonas sp. HZM]